MLKLNIGGGPIDLPGYTNIDRKAGLEAFPLTGIETESVDEVYASHILEHFGHGHIRQVLMEWVRVLKPGGVLKVAVPDFQKIAAMYQGHSEAPVQAYTMGGQIDDDDFHCCLFDHDTLYGALDAVGLIDIQGWKSEVADCAALPVSLNLQGMKPLPFSGKVEAVMSVPRLGFMDNFTCWIESLAPLGIKPLTVQGAYWGQCLERVMEQVAPNCDWLLVLDYDSFFTLADVKHLLLIAANHPECDAIAPLQMKRGTDTVPLMTRLNADGSLMTRGLLSDFQAPLMQVNTSHFGCTLIKKSALLKMAHPWFKGDPNKDGTWGEGRIDDDIYFWQKWKETGNTVYSANQVVIGHGEYTILWPDKLLRPTHQVPSDWRKNGTPANCWR